MPSVAERVSRHLVPCILAFVEAEYLLNSFSDRRSSTATNYRFPLAPNRKAKTQLLQTQLTLISKWKNPKAVFRAGDLRRVLLQFLGWTDDKLQQLALDGLLQWRDSGLNDEQVAILRELLDEKSFRDQLTRLVQSPTGEGAWAGPLSREGQEDPLRADMNAQLNQIDPSFVEIPPTHAPPSTSSLLPHTKPGKKDPTHKQLAAQHHTDSSVLLPWVLRILYGKMMRRHKAERIQSSRRATILAFVASLSDNLVAFYLHLLVEPFMPKDNVDDTGTTDSFFFFFFLFLFVFIFFFDYLIVPFSFLYQRQH